MNDTPQTPPTAGPAPGSQQASELIRQRLDELYQSYETPAPSPQTGQPQPDSLRDRFMTHHRHRHPDPQVAWARFYAELSDADKHRLWQEYQQQGGQLAQPVEPAPANELPPAVAKDPETIARTRQRLILKAKRQLKERSVGTRLKPWATAFAVGGLVLTYNYNNLIAAQVKRYVSPGAEIQSPIILDPNAEVKVTKEPRLIIPKINVDAHVVFDEPSYNESKIQAALDRGVVHYGETAFPGEAGNNVIIGHSSHTVFNRGKYKFVFVLLDKLQKGDTFIIHYEGTRYIYRVTKTYVTEATDFEPIQPTDKPTTTLITCTPLGTNWRRLIVQAEQISPKPSTAKPKTLNTEGAEGIPGDAPTPLQRLRDWVF